MMWVDESRVQRKAERSGEGGWGGLPRSTTQVLARSPSVPSSFFNLTETGTLLLCAHLIVVRSRRSWLFRSKPPFVMVLLP